MSTAAAPHSPFVRRHVGPDDAQIARMLETVGCASLDTLIDSTVPEVIRRRDPLDLPAPLDEPAALAEIRTLAMRNKPQPTYLGMGYYNCHTPPVILRNILENPGWYTAYTPYQAEIAQGRLEALLNFQTMVTDLTGMEIANASLLDEATAAAEAMTMAHGVKGTGHQRFSWRTTCHPQTIAVLRTRAEPLGHRASSSDHGATPQFDASVLRRPRAIPRHGRRHRGLRRFRRPRARRRRHVVIVAADLLALTLLKPPGEFGADIVVGSAQRFGVPLGYGGPHAAFLATRDDHKRRLPGRLIGVSKDAAGQPALRALPADPRTTHPPRKGHQQHLHRPGAARRHGLHVCRLPRPGRTSRHRPTHP